MSAVRMDSTDRSSSANSFGNRDAHVRLLMRSKENEFLTKEKLRLFVGTWNVNGRPASEDILPWLVNARETPPSLIVLGFQELDLSKEALVFADSVRETEWRTECERAVNQIHPDYKYQMVQLVRMVGVMLVVFASDSLVEHIDGVATGTVPTGIMGFMNMQRKPLGNKGGVAIRLEVHNTSVCFITSHLAAHMEQKERRNQDYRDIKDRMAFSGPFIDVNSNNLTIASHDLIFWLGDLNYRITDIPIEKVKLLINDKNWAPLLLKDQLIGEREANNSFEGYKESQISFPPSYKYDVGTNEYDTSEKMRCPAWTDRILHRGADIEPLKYDSHMGLLLSDHKPVSHTFDIKVKVINNDSYKSVYEDVMKHLDKLENEYLPQVKLNKLELDFGEVRFMESSRLTLEITNTGQVPADFSFIPKLHETNYSKDWLSIRPYRDCILPGDTATLDLEVYVNDKTASTLNSGEDKLEDILVLHLEGGKDFFLTVLGTYTLSCFGCSLEALTHLPTPIRDTPPEKIHQLEKGLQVSEPGKASMPIPKELYFLLDNISKKGKSVEDLFQQRGLHQEIVFIRESLDTSLSAQLPGSIHSLSEALLIYLDSLREPVIPYSMYDDALSQASDRLACEELVNRLPPTHKAVFHYLIEFMLELLANSHKNNLDATTLGNVFGSMIIRTNSDKMHTKSDKQLLEQRKAMFISNFLYETRSTGTVH